MTHSTMQDAAGISHIYSSKTKSRAGVLMCRPSPGRLPQVLGGLSDPRCESLSYVVSSYPCEGTPFPLALNSRSLAQRSGTFSFSHVDH